MSRFLNGGNRFLGPPQFVGRGKPIPSPVEQSLDPALFEGAVVYSTDGQLYYSDRTAWLIPTATVQIGRPAALPPTDSREQTQLRLTPFYSPQGLTQTGVYFEVASSPDSFDTPLFTRDIATTSGNGYQIVYPGDGLTPGQAFWWRGLYTGTDASQSDFSLPYRQVYPELIDTPTPVTNDGATSGAVTISAFTSRFGLSYTETEVRFWEIGADPDTEAPFATTTGIGGASVGLPEALVEGASYLWRARYGGQAGAGAPVVYSGWTETRTVNNGAASMSLVFDVDLAIGKTVSLGLGALAGSTNITVDWGDGTSDAYSTGGVRSHTYGAGVSGQVTVVVSGQMAQFGGNHDITGLVRMDAIGYQLGLTSLEQAFRNVTPNTTHVNPALPPQVTSLRGAFRNGNPGFDVGSLDTSSITDMSEMFSGAVDFNGDLSGLDTSAVTDTSFMFYNAVSFNQPIAAWDTSSVQTMESMFAGNREGDGMTFNHPIGTWDVSNVTSMRRMFCETNAAQTHRFDQDIGAWDVSSVTDMSQMFGHGLGSSGGGGNHRFNNGGSDSIRTWNVSGVITFEGMFGAIDNNSAANLFNQPLDGWTPVSATNMKKMFYRCGFNRDLGSWDMSGVQDCSNMFALSNMNSPLTGWDLSAASDASSMFNGCPFNADTTGWKLPSDATGLMRGSHFNHASVNTWDLSGTTSIKQIFNSAREFNQPVSGWDTSNVSDMSDAFRFALIFNQDINAWEVSSVSNMDDMFHDARAYDKSMEGWALNPAGVSMSNFGRDTNAYTDETYARTLVGWANTGHAQNGPFNVSMLFEAAYTSTVHAPGGRFGSADAARAFLTRSRRAAVSSASDANANGSYFYNGATQQYEQAAGWYFSNTGSAWDLRDETGAVQATEQDATHKDNPYQVTTWDGVLAAAAVDLDGMGWTISNYGAA